MLGAGPAAAQPGPAAATAIETVVVTARKREENLQDVPVALTAFSARTIEDARLDTIEDFASLTPNVELRATNSRTSGIDVVIRGVSSDIHQEPGFGLYEDGAYVGGIAKAFGNFNDLERVEVLRGPQGALYGRNAVGGSINIINAQPADVFGARLDGLAGSHERFELRGMVNVPLSDQLAVRFSGFGIKQDKGEYYNVTLNEELNREESYGLRGRARFEASDTLSFLFTAAVVGEDAGYNPRLNVAAGETPRTLHYNTPTRNTLHGHDFTGQADWDAGWTQVTGILSFRTEDSHALADFDQTAAQSLVLEQDVDRDTTFAELRAVSPAGQPFSWILGANYYGEDRASLLDSDVDLGLGFLGASFASLQTFSNARTTTTSYSAFAEVGYDIAERLNVGASVRYNRDHKKLGYEQGIPELIGLPGPFAVFSLPPFQLSTTDAQDFENVSPGGSLFYKLSDTVNLYARVGTGFRAGGFNTVVSNPAFLPFDAETSVNYEVGLKSELLDHKLRLNLAGFRLDQSDLIVDVMDPNPLFASIGQTYSTNAGAARTYGFELDATARPAEGLDVTFNLGVLDAELTDFVTPAGVSVAGNKPPGAADGNIGALIFYRWPLAGSLEGFANVKYSQTWGGFQDIENLIALDDHSILDLKLGVESGGWRAVAFVDNVTDDDYILNRNATLTSVLYAPGRTFGLQAAYRW
ncbi:MAG TPA: TonB-dependent receptor [Rhizomicrobium sp.]